MPNKIDKEIFTEIRAITKDKAQWNTAIDDVAAKLGDRYSAAVKAKALWLLGEMGLQYPLQVQPYLEQIAGYLTDDNPKLRERSVNALGRIGRANKDLILPYFGTMMNMRSDTADEVRLAFVWACENIAMFIFSRCNSAAEKHVEFAYANVAYCMYAIAYQFSILKS